jgi:hypothetical protein
VFVPTKEQVSKQVSAITDLSKQSPILYFDEFINSLARVYENYELPDEIRIPKPNDKLLKKDLEPVRVINLREVKHKLKYGNLNMWRCKHNNQFMLHGFGLIDNNKSKPFLGSLFDTSPHMYLGGATGHGKSVTLNDLIIAAALVHPPWKIQYYLNDPKITELAPYANYKYVMPHVNTVAATPDPNYTISMLQYIIDVMNTRNKIFTVNGVKNIDTFNSKFNLEMPMLVLILDECKSMYLYAKRQASTIDKLIEMFVALARNAGGRCVMASQQLVSEMSADTMANINIRAALGCQPNVSSKIIGNDGSSQYLGQYGKLIYNSHPGDGRKSDNIHITSPFLPDKPTSETKQLTEVFDYIHEMWQLCGGGRLESFSFYDEEKIIQGEYFDKYISDKVNLKNVFLGEPAFVYKRRYSYYSISLTPSGKFSTAMGCNFMCLSPIADMRFNFIAIWLCNLKYLKKTEPSQIQVYTTIKDIASKIEAMNYPYDSLTCTLDLEESLWNSVASIAARVIICKADDTVFSGKVFDDNPIYNAVLDNLSQYSNRGRIPRNRVYAWMEELKNPQYQQIFDLPQMGIESASIYADYLQMLVDMISSLKCDQTQVVPQLLPKKFLLYSEFDQVHGVEVKTQTSKLELWCNLIRLGPVYGVYTIIIASMLPFSGSVFNPAFDRLLLYSVTPNMINIFKLQDDYPEYNGKFTLVYTDKSLPGGRCVKLKYPSMVKVGDMHV